MLQWFISLDLSMKKFWLWYILSHIFWVIIYINPDYSRFRYISSNLLKFPCISYIKSMINFKQFYVHYVWFEVFFLTCQFINCYSPFVPEPFIPLPFYLLLYPPNRTGLCWFQLFCSLTFPWSVRLFLRKTTSANLIYTCIGIHIG